MLRVSNADAKYERIVRREVRLARSYRERGQDRKKRGVRLRLVVKLVQFEVERMKGDDEGQSM